MEGLLGFGGIILAAVGVLWLAISFMLPFYVKRIMAESIKANQELGECRQQLIHSTEVLAAKSAESAESIRAEVFELRKQITNTNSKLDEIQAAIYETDASPGPR